MDGVSREGRVRSLAFVLLLHGIAAWLVAAFAHTSFLRAPDRVVATFDVSPAEPPPLFDPPSPAPVTARETGRAGAAGRAPSRPSPAAAQSVLPDIIPPGASVPAPAAPSGGSEASGVGGGAGSGAGSSGSGASARGAGGGEPVVGPRLRGGRIEPRDYPRAAGGAQGLVTAQLAIGADGRVTGCRIALSSGNALLDATTCRLIRERFRFTPARNAQGEAVPSEYGWQQRWWRD